MKNKLLIGYLCSCALLFAACLLQSCGSKKETEVAAREKYIIPDSLLKTLTIDSVQKKPLVDAITLTGSVDFNQDNQVSIYPLVSGNIQNMKVQIGDYVNAGQVLAIVKSGEMANYGNNLINAQTNLTVTKKNLEAQKDMSKSGLSSSLDLAAAQSNYDQAVAQLEMVQRILKINGNNSKGDYIIKSPISGFIVQKNITNNTSIRTDNGSVLFSISDLKNVWVQANVYESNISKVHLGDEVDVTTVAYPDRVFKGKVDKILNVLDPTSKVMKMRVALSNADYALKPQMFTRITVTNKGNGEALCIPTKALIFDHSQYFVLAYHGKGSADITPVTVINTIGDKTYLSGGVQQGQQVVASQAILIYEALNN